jgi:glutathione synthase/RimK-type ligase-like ATP-grasp enzyme
VPLDVALVTCLTLPEPDADLAPLLDALRAAGLSADALAWDDRDSDDRFAAARATILRSTWNYSERPADFLAWVDRVSARTALYNGPATVRWNAHKSYLLDLEARGVPVVPTYLARRGDATALADVLAARGWSDAVVKPAVSGGSRQTIRVGPATLDRGEAHLRSLVAHEDVLVQPYLASVEDHGERAIVWIDGETTHAVRKSPRFAGDEESISGAVAIEPDEAALARAAIAAAVTTTGPLLYARVDVARDARGVPCLMELELIEPSLFFARAPAALQRYVAAVTRRLSR